MIDMKKKKSILPRILAVASLVGIIVLTLYMSPFVPYAAMSVDLSLNKKPIYITHFSKLCDFAEKAVKLSENESTVYSAVSLFSPNGVCFEKDRSYYPDDFFEKCLYYNQLALDYMEKNGTDNIFEGPYDYFTDYKSGYMYDNNIDAYYNGQKSMVKCHVAYSMFLLGRVDEAKSYIETMIKDFKSTAKAEDGYALSYVRFAYYTYFTETYALSNDESYKAWVTDKSTELTQALKELDGGKGNILSPDLYNKDNIFPIQKFEDYVKVYNQE